MTDPATCTLRAFLRGPDAAPAPDWVAAVTHRGLTNDESTAFAERALAALRRADEAESRIADLRVRRSPPSRHDEAVGVLMAAFNVEADRAFECFLWVGQQSDNPLHAVTRQFVQRQEALGARGHDREALLAVLDDLAGRGVTRAG